MGEVRMGPPNKLILELREIYGIENFVETGTYLGDTAHWAGQHFKHVSTIEYSNNLYQQAIRKYGNIRNIQFLWGHTRDKLGEIVYEFNTPSVFWLDAHWCEGSTYGLADQCPLIEEIGVINRSALDNFIFIDDARFFMSPPPPPNLLEQWPDITKLLNALNSGKTNRYIVIIEDVIIAVPDFAKPIVARYCQNVNARLLRKRLRLIFHDLNLALRDPKKTIRWLFP